MTPAGAFYDPSLSRFCVWAPSKKNIELVIESGEAHQIFPMKKSGFGYWEVHIPAEPGTKYRYRIDGDHILPDPASRLQPDGVHGASELVDPSFNWTDHTWKGRALGDMIIYELHTGCFSKTHDFPGIISHLPYLKNLGINTIELMPVNAFPGKRNWGYDGVYPFAVQESYGGPAALKQLVDAAHGMDIAVLLDVVYNHLGPDGNYFSAYGPWFTKKYSSFWGDSINFDDAWSDGVRDFFIQNALMWLEDFHVDGLRLDAVHAIIDRGALHVVKQLKDEVEKLEQRTGLTKLLIAEIDLNDTRYLNDATKGGYGLDGQWVDEFHHALHVLITGERSGYYEDFGEMHHLLKAFEKPFVYDGNYSVHRKRYFGSDPSGLSPDRFVIFSQNHDQIGNRMLGDRLSSALSISQLKLVAAATLLAPYTPLLFMGEEYGEKNPFQFFVDHTDAELIEKTRSGRKEEFKAFHSDGEVPDPGAEQTFLHSCLSWLLDSPEAIELQNWYRLLISFRKNCVAMQGRSRSSWSVALFADSIIVLDRFHEQDRVKILLNFSQETRKIPVSDMTSALSFDFIINEHNVTVADNFLPIPAYGVVVLQF